MESSVKSLLPVPADLESVSCAACGSDQSRRLLNYDSFGFPVGLVECLACGFAYCSPRPTERYMSRFYEKHYLAFYEGAVRLNDAYVKSHQLVEAASDRLTRYAKLVPQGGRVLDVGCGLGYFLEAVRKARPDVHVEGIEPGTAQTRYAREVLSVPVFHGNYQQYHSPTRFDLVTAFHVAEHVHDLGGFLRFMKAQLKPTGHVIIESPNLEGDWADFGMFHVAHLYAFTPASLCVVAERNGLDVVSVNSSEHGWDKPNLHAILRPAVTTGTQRLSTSAHLPEAIRARFSSVRKPRWRAVAKSWLKLALHYFGLGEIIDRVSHRTPLRAR